MLNDYSVVLALLLTVFSFIICILFHFFFIFSSKISWRWVICYSWKIFMARARFFWFLSFLPRFCFIISSFSVYLPSSSPLFLVSSLFKRKWHGDWLCYSSWKILMRQSRFFVFLSAFSHLLPVCFLVVSVFWCRLFFIADDVFRGHACQLSVKNTKLSCVLHTYLWSLGWIGKILL